MRLRRVQRAGSAEDGFTLAEMLVVLAILGTVLAGLTVLFTASMRSQTDQTNRTRAQQDARTALDKLRRELRCASGVSSSTLPQSVTVSIPGYCRAATSTALATDLTVPSSGTFTVGVSSISGFNLGATAKNEILVGSSTPITCTAADAATNTFSGCSGGTAGLYLAAARVGSSVTWCTTSAGPSYSLKRYVGGAAVASPGGVTCSGAGGLVTATSLADNAVFAYNTVASSAAKRSGGSLDAGTYYYDVTAVTAAGEISGTVTSCVTDASNRTCRITWTAYTGASAYNVYGRDNGSSQPRISPVAGQNTTPEVPQGLRLIATVPAATSFFDDTNAVDTAVPGLQQPPLGTVTVSLVADMTPADTQQRFVLNDVISLRNNARP
jgi:prepilin-type N-terminal cleavage/methylation domain-containing protein